MAILKDKLQRGTAKKLLYGKQWSYWPCRCNRRNCQQRITLRKHPDDYVNYPMCDCGGKLYVDYYRAGKAFRESDRGSPSCHCDGYEHPHNTNSTWCRDNPKQPTDEQYRERYSYV